MAVTRDGQEFYYENFAAGWGKHPEHQDVIVLGITDKDNEEVHLFPMTMQRFEQLIAVGHQTAAGIKIQVAGAQDMPKGPQG